MRTEARQKGQAGFVLGLSTYLLFTSPLAAQTLFPEAVRKAEAKKDGKDAKKGSSTESRIRNAERIARLQLAMQQDADMRDKLKVAFDKANEEVRKISGELAAFEAGVQAKTQQLAKLAAAAPAEEKVILEGELKDLALQKDVAAEHLVLTLKERKLLGDRLAAAEQKIVLNQATLEGLLNEDAGPKPTEDGTTDRRLAKAREEAKLRDEQAKEAELAKKSLEQRIKAMEEFLELDRNLLENERKRLELGQAQLKTLEEERQLKRAKAAPAGEIEALTLKIDLLIKRQEETQASVKERTERIARLEQTLTAVRGEKALVEKEVAVKKSEADQAQADVKRLENPFNPKNILRWLVDHGPRLGLILLGMLGLTFVVRSMDNRLIRFMAHRSHADRPEERENRARTLAAVFHNFAMMLVMGGGILMMLEEIGIPVIPLMGGAAILGLAVAFGAQNLIKDYFYGFVILLENQYTVNDVIKIGAICGSVERISLRMTVLRDLEGIVHFIPHGQVTTVSNLTHGWSRASFEIAVPYRENADRVMEVLVHLGAGLRRDPLWEDLILEEPEMLGVDKFSDSALVIKFLMKTKPLQQWRVKREMMRRIKKTFDDLGIWLPKGAVIAPPLPAPRLEASEDPALPDAEMRGRAA